MDSTLAVLIALVLAVLLIVSGYGLLTLGISVADEAVENSTENEIIDIDDSNGFDSLKPLEYIYLGSQIYEFS